MPSNVVIWSRPALSRNASTSRWLKPLVAQGHVPVSEVPQNDVASRWSWVTPSRRECDSGQEAKRMGSALVSAGLVELALFTMT